MDLIKVLQGPQNLTKKAIRKDHLAHQDIDTDILEKVKTYKTDFNEGFNGMEFPFKKMGTTNAVETKYIT